MRTSHYYGLTFGVVATENRRGTLSSVTIGTVDRNPPEGATWTCRYAPTHTVGKPLSMQVITHQISAARLSLEGEALAAAIDKIAQDAIAAPFPMAHSL